MPYIKQERKTAIWAGDPPDNAGELNYIITLQIRNYFEKKGKSYQTYNDIIGALEGAKLELYRRRISLYEDKKRKDNGDVY